MAHFAYVENGFVKNVHVVANPVITDENGLEQESLGQEFLSTLHGLPSINFIQCSYNANFRGNYPGVGFTYHEEKDAFIPPQPFPSWILNQENYLWQSPIAYPEDGERYSWDEDAGDWVAVPEVPEA